MAFYRNTAAKNNSEVTNIHFVECEVSPPKDFGYWDECSEDDVKSSKYGEYLYKQGDFRFYGKL